MHENEELILVDEDGVQHSFTLIDVVMVDDKRYALLEPTEPDEDDEEGAYLFRLESDGNDERLVIVEDDDEFDRVVAVLSEFEMEDDDHVHGPHCNHDHQFDEED